MLLEIVEPNFKFKDQRGELVQLVRKDYKQVNVIFSLKNVLRGNHYHKINSELFYVISGKLKLHVKKEELSEEYIFSKGDMFKIPPYVLHSFYYEEDTWLVSMYDKGVELQNGEKDIYE